MTATKLESPSDPRTTSRLRLRPFIVAFVVTLLALELTARVVATQLPEPLVWPRYEVQRKIDRIETLAETGCLDNVVLGTSVANAGIDAALLEARLEPGARVYNASLGGAGVDGIVPWVDEVITPLACPGHVIIGVSVRDLNDSNDAGDFTGRYERALGRTELLDEATAVQRFELWSLRNVGLVRLRQNLRNPASTLAWLLNEGGPWRELNDDHGTLTRFTNRPYDTRSSRRTFDRQVVFNDYAAGGRRSDELAEVIRALQAQGTAVTLVMLPYTEAETLELLPRGAADLDAYETAIFELGAGSGATVLDLTGLVSTREFFADDYHLNGDGAEIVTEELARRLGEAE